MAVSGTVFRLGFAPQLLHRTAVVTNKVRLFYCRWLSIEQVDCCLSNVVAAHDDVSAVITVELLASRVSVYAADALSTAVLQCRTPNMPSPTVQ